MCLKEAHEVLVLQQHILLNDGDVGLGLAQAVQLALEELTHLQQHISTRRGPVISKSAAQWPNCSSHKQQDGSKFSTFYYVLQLACPYACMPFEPPASDFGYGPLHSIPP